MENVIKRGMANLWKGKEAVGGKLYLTSQHLTHEAHKMNINKEKVEIKLSDIDHLEFYTNKVLGLPLMKNGLKVVDKENQQYKFVVNKRANWKNEIEALL
ncbi:GRAM domain-containing protein [Gracilibacillus caseinilyticus]|uniref:GRAM domain-containing protein n=1 Tax=Gracilibacillus caseinilyticus TaxID=2932256 RepID=A0ABY4EWU1_9BACI|nr:GRAM domain-containing protein [Gracilibacillus caseinilyticus]UOQ48754.1 GRAM domain-containing protein [Gracilibacillus caseinilyticus]